MGLAEALKDKNVLYYMHSDFPLLDNDKYKKIFQHLLASDTIGAVILSGSPFGYLKLNQSHITLENKIIKTVNMLIAGEKNVYFTDFVPQFPFGLARCMWPRWPFSKKCALNKEFIDSTQGFFLRSLENVLQSAPRLRLIHLMEHLRDEQTYSMVHNGLLMYRDHNHLSIYGSKYIGAKIVAEYLELRN